MPRPARIDMIGQRYGSLIVTAITEPVKAVNGRSRRMAIAICDCGNKIQSDPGSISTGATSSCGCARVKHGHAIGANASRTYNSWAMMMDRCRNPNNDRYERYGGRGIKVCDRWHEFANFLSDMRERPDDTSIDRIDSDGNYEPGNCQWATIVEQNRNRSVTIFVRYKGDVLSLKECSRLLGESYQVARRKFTQGKAPFVTASVEVISSGR